MMSAQPRGFGTQWPAARNSTAVRADTRIFDKTRLCKYFAKGRCKRGGDCTFAHGQEELAPQPDFFKSQLCADLFRHGVCRSGADCMFAHSPQELRRPHVPKRLAHHEAEAVIVQSWQLQQRNEAVDAVRAELMQLQAQLEALHSKATQAIEGIATFPTDSKCSGDGDVSDGLVLAAQNFSRLSTEDVHPNEKGSFSRQTSRETDSWCEDFEIPGVLEQRQEQEASEQPEAPISVAVVIKNTFVTLVPQDAITAKCRRPKSTSPMHQRVASV